MCKFTDIADEPKTPSFFAGMYGSDYPLLDHYWREQSYNQINVTGSQAISQWVILAASARLLQSIGCQRRKVIGVDLNKLAADCTAAADLWLTTRLSSASI